MSSTATMTVTKSTATSIPTSTSNSSLASAPTPTPTSTSTTMSLTTKSTQHTNPKPLDATLHILATVSGAAMWFVDALLTHLHHHLTLNVKPYDAIELLIYWILTLIQVRLLLPLYILQSRAVQTFAARSVVWKVGVGMRFRERSARRGQQQQQQQKQQQKQRRGRLLLGAGRKKDDGAAGLSMREKRVVA